jgi:ATP-dependent Lhr-like helicase
VEQKALARFEVGWQGVSADPPRGRNALTDAIRQLTGTAIPASTLERDVLSARVAEPGTGIDELMLAGDLVWVGEGALGQKDGRVSLYPRETLGTLWPGPDSEFEPGERGTAIVATLESRGAIFFRDLYEAVGGGDPEETLDSLWDLVWAGHVTNDTFGPVRSFVSRRKSGTGGRRALSSRFPAHAQGRWSLTGSLVGAPPDPTERHAAWAELLLDRHGVVTRRTVLAEGFPGGFSALYPIYGHLEETGRIRRGYFVEGLGGSQFALPGAVDRLRGETSTGMTIVAATDPANPYGGVLPWPEVEETRLARDAGAYVLILDGELIGYLDKGRRGLTLFDVTPNRFREVSRAIAEVAGRHRRLTLMTVNGQPASTSQLAAPLSEWGFATAPRGLTYRS